MIRIVGHDIAIQCNGVQLQQFNCYSLTPTDKKRTWFLVNTYKNKHIVPMLNLSANQVNELAKQYKLNINGLTITYK